MYQKKTETNMYQRTEAKYFQQAYIVKQIWKVDLKIRFSIFYTFIIFNLFSPSCCLFAILRFPWVSCSLLSLDLCHYFSLQHSQHYWLLSLTPIFYYPRHEINMNVKKYTNISSTILNLEVCDSSHTYIWQCAPGFLNLNDFKLCRLQLPEFFSTG